MTEKPPFKVGDKVAMNDYGFEQVHIRSLAAFKASQCLTITKIEPMVGTGITIWLVEVDHPEINTYLLDNQMFNKIPK